MNETAEHGIRTFPKKILLRDKIHLPLPHIKFGLIKYFVNLVNKDGEGFDTQISTHERSKIK